MKITPSLLAEDFESFIKLVKKAEAFTDYVQVDLMDGSFVATRSFSAAELNRLATSLAFEVHLMFDDPLSAVEAIRNGMLREVIFHIESKANAPELVRTIKDRGLKAGVALNPETDPEVLQPLGAAMDTILLLAVDPGRYGSPFKPEVLDKVPKIRKLYPEASIGVDGGVSFDTLDRVKASGVDFACVGSKIFLEPDPAASYLKFLKRSAGQRGR